MAEILEKLRPDRDLQCYFERPSAVAALSGASATGFTVSGTFRQQFDWAVLEWNRDNVFEHHAFRYLPDGDLSGLELTYEETRTNCIPIDSDLYATVEWPYLRIWVGNENLPRLVSLRDHATALEGTPQRASATLELHGTVTDQDVIGLAWNDEQYNYAVTAGQTIEQAAAGLEEAINTFSTTVTASRAGAGITLTAKTASANWNRVGVYGFVSGMRTESWSPWWAKFSGGTSPRKWRIHLDFSNLPQQGGGTVPMNAVRKMRWTYAADLQNGPFQRTEFSAVIENWTVTGTNRAHHVAGPGSRRIEDDDGEIRYTGEWAKERWNYSGGTAHYTRDTDASATCNYYASTTHRLYLGTRKVNNGGPVAIQVDGVGLPDESTAIPLEEVMTRVPLGEYGPGPHSVVLRYLGTAQQVFYFDFLEIAVPTVELPAIAADDKLSLATDWDTDHSICVPAERTAWMIHSLGFRGRVNHYVGALWFYDLVRADHVYASATVRFSGTPAFAYGEFTELKIGRVGETQTTPLTHVHLIGDTAETIAKAFELAINRAATGIRAVAEETLLTIYARAMGLAGEEITVSVTSTSLTVEASGNRLSGAAEGVWRTDLEASPRLNRAARDWHRAFFAALHGAGLTAVAALSMELRDVDPSVAAGMVQRCPHGDPVFLPLTPAYQTNFSPESVAYWREAYRDLATLMETAGMQPYLQFGEVQWWYYRDDRSGMPYYDQYTKDVFRAQYGRELREIADDTVRVADYPEEAAFLPGLIGAFTGQVIAYVRQTFPTCRFESLYPLDANEREFNRKVNYPESAWTSAILDCLKTENFGFTYSRDLDKCKASILLPQAKNFPPGQGAHLVGISDSSTAWEKEVRLARSAGLESVVLFALDQFCLIGYQAPLPPGSRRSVFQG